MRKLCGIILLSLTLASCSGLDLVKGAADMALGGSQPGVEVDANVAKGDAEGDDSVAQNANTAVSLDAGSKEVFEGAVGQVVNEAGLPIHVLLLVVLLAGWAIPSPAQCVLGGVRVFRQAIDIARGRSL
jgi:hypothetical protein